MLHDLFASEKRYINGVRLRQASVLFHFKLFTKHKLFLDRNPNIALGKPTAQSSDDDNWSAPSFRAVDGIKDTDYHRGASCTHTRLQTRPWWKVDLLKEVH